MLGGKRVGASLAALALLAGCARLIPEGGTRPLPPTPTPTPTAASALLAGVKKGPGIGSLQLGRDDAGAALASFVESCPRLLRRDDTSGLTRAADWRPACDAAVSWNYSNAREFFSTYFETAVVGDGQALALMWVAKAAAHGHVIAQRQLAGLLMPGKA